MTGLSADTDIAADTDLFGLTVTDLQDDVTIDGTSISGTLKYISTGWDPGTWSAAESTGNYIALHFEVPDVEGVTITVTVTNPVTLDADGIVVLRIADKDTQTITVVASKEGYDSVTKVYTLTGLTLEEESA